MILVAPTAFKGTLSASAVAEAIAGGVHDALGDFAIRLLPLSDGGDGLIEALAAAGDGAVDIVTVTGPLGEAVSARVLRDGAIATVESADACGLHRIEPSRRDPLRATTRGVGELIREAARSGPALLRVGLGGSATVDGGAGMAAALGWRLLDDDRQPIPDGGAGLLRLHAIEPPETPLRLPPIVALVDVLNPLLGLDGAAPVFAPQKGASPAQVELLADSLERLAARLRDDVGIDVGARPGPGGAPGAGGGAAGGLGAGLAGFLGAELRSGSGEVLREIGFDAALREASLLITGEGSYDAQSRMGKVAHEALVRAAAAGVPAVLVAARIETEPPAGVVAVHADGEMVAAEWIRYRVADTLRTL